MNNKIITIVVLIIVIILGGIWYAQKDKAVTPATGEPIKVGAVYAMTGPAAKFGEISVQGIRDAAKYFEEQTGRKTEILVEDSAGDPKQGVSAATKLYNVDKVEIVLAGTSAISAAIAPVAETVQKVLISDAALLGLTKDKTYTLQNFMPSLVDIPKQVNENDEWQKIAIVYINDEFGNVWAETIKADINSPKTVETFSFEKTATDYRTNALKVKQFAPDVVVVIGYGPALNQVLADLEFNKIEALRIGYLSCTLPGVIGDARYSLEGDFSYEYPPITAPDFKKWVGENGGGDNAFYTVAFENALLALTAVSETNGTALEALAYLKDKSIDGLWGKIEFNNDGVVNRELVLTKITNGKCEPVK